MDISHCESNLLQMTFVAVVCGQMRFNRDLITENTRQCFSQSTPSNPLQSP